jgi:hypothetical protein
MASIGGSVTTNGAISALLAPRSVSELMVVLPASRVTVGLGWVGIFSW